MTDLVLLTREGCANTPGMRERLDAALASFERPPAYALVGLGTLADDDVRRGYPTPTVLYKDRDLFGMPAPTPPFPEPS